MDSGGQRPTVLVVSFADVVGGAERSLLALVTRLPARGWSPVLACPRGALAHQAARAGVQVVELRVTSTRQVSRRSGDRKTYSAGAAVRYLLATLGNAWRVARLVRRVRPALVHSNSLSSHVAVALAGVLGRRPVLWHLRELIEPGPGRRFFNRVGRLTAGMVAISGAVADSVTHPRVSVVYNPIETPPHVVPRSWDVPRPVVGYLGRLDPRKGIEDLLTASGGFDAHIVVVGQAWAGSEAYVSSLRALAETHAPGRVHFVGSVPEPWPALAAFDVLVVPSLAEPFGRVAAEGQRAGVAVLAAAAGGLPEIVTDGHDGLLFRPSDPDDLASCLRRVLADDALRARLARAGVDSSTRFEPDQHADAMVQIFARHAGSRGYPRTNAGDRGGVLAAHRALAADQAVAARPAPAADHEV